MALSITSHAVANYLTSGQDILTCDIGSGLSVR